MKQLLLAALVIVSLVSCVKTKTIEHDIHDTLLMQILAGVDTVNHFAIIHDTVTRSSVSSDTVQVVKHDTLYITTTRVDTLLRYFIDTAYITRTVHDTVIRVQTIVKVQHDTTRYADYDTVFIAKNVVVHDTVTRNVYLHDTVNYTSVVYLHDTIVRIDKVITHDTVLRYNSLYPVPATDSVVMFYYCDTPNHPYKSIYGADSGAYVYVASFTFTSVIPSPDGTYQTFTAIPRYDTVTNRLSTTRIPYTGPGSVIHTWIVVAPKMLCTVTINYGWSGGVMTQLYSYGVFEQQPATTWTMWSWGHIGACGNDTDGGCSNTTVAIPLYEVDRIAVYL
jgi:hypothetical protein